MRKGILAAVLVLAGTGILLTACGENTAPSSVVSGDGSSSGQSFDSIGSHTVTVADGEGFTLSLANGGPLPSAVADGTELALEVTVADGFAGVPRLFANEVEIAGNANGIFVVTITADTTISISSIYRNITGIGTEENPYVIYNSENLKNVRDGYFGINNPETVHYVLGGDIDLGGASWEPWGDLEHSFESTFDGAGHTISNFRIQGFGEGNYGFFGVGYGAFVRDLSLSGAQVLVTDEDEDTDYIYAGSLFGLAYSVSVENVAASGDIMIASDIAYSVAAGGLVGAASVIPGYASGISASSFTGSVDASKAAESITGGLVGMTGRSGMGVVYLQNNRVSASLVAGGGEAGGIVGQLDYFASLSWSVAEIGKISVVGTNGLIGGAVAVSNFETAVVGNIVSVVSVEATSPKALGALVAVASTDGYEEGLPYRGTATFANYFIDASGKLSGASGTSPVALSELTAGKLAEAGFSEQTWDLNGGGLPDLKDNKDAIDTTLIAISGTDRAETVLNGIYDPLDYKELLEKKEGLLTAGLYLDAETTVYYPEFLPLQGEAITLYGKYVSYSEIAGVYTGYCSNGTEAEAITKDFVLEFQPDNTVKWTNGDYETLSYEFWFDGLDMLMENRDFTFAFRFVDGEFRFADQATSDESYVYNFRRASEFYGYYTVKNSSAEIIIRNDNVLVYDGNEVPYVLDGDKVSFTFAYMDFTLSKGQDGSYRLSYYDDDLSQTINLGVDYQGYFPAYGEADFIGAYYLANGRKLVLRADGNADMYNAQGTLSTTGAFRRYSNISFDMRVWGVYTKMAYSPADDVFTGYFAGDNVLLSRDPITAAYGNGSGMTVYAAGDRRYVVSSGKLLSGSTVTGDLAEGGTVTITDSSGETTSYVITDGILVVKAPVDYSEVAGTYTGTTTEDDSELVLAADGTGSWNGAPVVYTYEDGAVSFVVDGVEYVLSYDSAHHTLIGSYEKDGTTYHVSLSGESTEPVAKSIYGIWEAKLSSGTTIEIVIGEDGSIDYNGNVATDVSLTATGASFVVGDLEVTLLYNAQTDTMSGHFEQDYETYNYASIIRK